ncbi:MAG: DUF1289 domain-containing protein [Rhodospirillales bacterium]|nr:DUF1289 domain-containing protein [Rhodospirillales bacterium]
MTVPSPCTNVCLIDPDSDLCQGCFRTLDEIANWGSFSDDEQRTIIRKVGGRGRTLRADLEDD